MKSLNLCTSFVDSEKPRHQPETCRHFAAGASVCSILRAGIVSQEPHVKAWKGDRGGNLIYRRTARNFNPMMATAAKVTIAEVEDLVETGTIDPDHIVTPGIYVHHIFQGKDYQKRIERRTVRRG